ncbi:BURP domain-containing protein BNM2C-like [Pistacia vera]|uniref:BURP domain-containing protein BNM2C-like n=1 Tax=Pistacia vera TaxID=55513 RepID=UPI001263B5C7|nr:BURP domain-containing protein BNM2C-like [Pistacia vera]
MKMGLGFAAWNVFLCLLLFMSAYRSGAKEMTDILSQIGHNHDALHHVHAHQSSHMDPSSMVFFTMKDLKKGITMPIYFRVNELSNVFPHLLPREEADSIPFSLEQLPFLLKHFSFSKDSTHYENL